jgi:hypothetical protein
VSRYTAEEGRELARRLAEARSQGGIPHAEVEERWRSKLAEELRRLVADYTGAPGQESMAKDILETWAVARDAGAPCADIEQELIRKLSRRAA